MKRIGISLIFSAALAAAVAQTNVTTRALSLDDCIQSALAHNFDLQIQRYDPQLSLYGLYADYGGYDPTFNLSGEHKWNSGAIETNGYSATTLIGTNAVSKFVLFPRSSSDQNLFNTDLGGSLPWGLNYDLVASLTQTYGPNYSGTTNLLAGEGKTTDGSVEVDLTQHLLKNFWIDTTRLTIQVDKNRLKYAGQTLRQHFIDTITLVENAYYELIYAQEFVKVQQEALTLAQTQLNQDRQKVQVGSLAPLDVQQDEAAVAQNQASLIAAQFALAKDENALKNLITDAYAQWHDVAIQPTATLEAPRVLFDLQDSWNKGMTTRPDLLQARLDVEKQGIELKFDRNQLFPALDVVGSYGYGGANQDYSGTFDQINTGDQPYYTFGAKLSMPLGNVSARNTLKAGKVTEKVLLLTLKQLEQTILVAIDNAVKQAQSDYESVEASRQARTYAEAALDAEQKKYAVGKSTTFTVLQLQDTLTADRALEIRALANYNEDLANLAQQEGSTLARHKIDVQAK